MKSSNEGIKRGLNYFEYIVLIQVMSLRMSTLSFDEKIDYLKEYIMLELEKYD